MSSNNRVVPTFHRYVAIGDSSTEGLVDPDGYGGYRGWADRLAQLIADAQEEPLEYANLAVRSLRLNEMRADLAAMYGEARAHDCTVLTFTLPDPTSINPFGKHLKDRMFRFNDIVRAEAERYDVLVMDFQNYPIAEDPRLWFEDRLHGNELGHQRTAAALAWRLGIDGADESWAEPLDDEPTRLQFHQQLASDVDWIRRYLGPWLGKGIRGVPHGDGVDPKRPVPTVVPRTAARQH